MHSVIKHILTVGLGKITTNKKGSSLKSIVINDKTYRYNKDKALTKTLRNTLSNIEKYNKYRASKLLNQACDKNKRRSAVRKYASTQKATITDEQSAFRNYVNAYYISNIKLSGWKGFTYLKYQEDRLKQLLNENTGMKVLTQVDFTIITPFDEEDDEGNDVRKVIQFRSRRFEVLNTDDITATLTKMSNDIQTQISNSYLWSSDIVLNKIKKITINYDKYNPTRAGSYIELPKWVSSKKSLY